jgi:hypothetical protein
VASGILTWQRDGNEMKWNQYITDRSSGARLHWDSSRAKPCSDGRTLCVLSRWVVKTY